MIWIRDQYATVWETEDKGNYVKVKLGTSEKKQDGSYENSSWPMTAFIGKAKDKALQLQAKDRIKILSGKITNRFNQEKSQYFTNVAVFDFEMSDGYATQSSPPTQAQPKEQPPVRKSEPISEDLPF